MKDQLHDLLASWNDVIRACEKQSREAAALLHVVKPISVFAAGNLLVVTIETRYPFHRDRMLDHRARLAIQGAIGLVLDANTVIDVKLTEEVTGVPPARNPVKRPYRGRSGVVRSIPTEYGGYLMRSRLEAKTAHLLDVANIEWMYEPEGFDLRGTWYLPDFWLPENRLFLEVKGILDKNSEAKVTKLAQVCATNTPDIQVMLLYNVRARLLDSMHQAYVIGHIVTPTEILKDSICLARCPRCHRAGWKPIVSAICPICEYQHSSKHVFQAVIGE